MRAPDRPAAEPLCGHPIESRLPADVAAFIRDHITSIEQLEVLLLLRSESGRTWTAADLSGRLKTAPASIAERLESLARGGLATRDGEGFRFEPGRAAAVAALAACYASRRVAVIEAIFSGERSGAAAIRVGGDGLEPPTPWV